MNLTIKLIHASTSTQDTTSTGVCIFWQGIESSIVSQSNARSWILDVLVPVEINGNEEFIIGSPNISNEQVQEYLDRLNEFYETKMYELYEKVNEETGEIIGEFTPKKDEKIIRIVPISPTEIKTKSIINKEDIETKYGIVTYNPNKPNKKGND